MTNSILRKGGFAFAAAWLLMGSAHAVVLDTDRDNDSINNAADNCSGVANPDQTDADGDGYGNACDADFNNDGVINFIDYAQLTAGFLGTDPVLDLNNDGVVNFLDITLLTNSFLGAPGPSGVAASNLTLSGERVYAGVPTGSLMRLKQAPGDSSRWYGLQRQGAVFAFDKQDNAQGSTSVLEFSALVDTNFEGGALGFAFHPDFETNGYLYISYTTEGPNFSTPLISRISRFDTAPNSDGVAIADLDSEVVLIAVNQPFANHNGGDLSFGPDGYLYWSLGDGGGGGDTQNAGQNTTNLLSTFVRLDIDVTQAQIDQGITYLIPSDNPFASNADCTVACPEIYAWGVRNPFRFSFDRDTGLLWVGDVGQNAREEISIISNGGNYGWRCFEGFNTFNTSLCDLTQTFEQPQYDYVHALGRSVTGGYVYRGSAYPALQGTYLFGDFVSGRIWGLFEGDYMGERIATNLSLVAFAEDFDGELYYIELAFGGNSEIYRLTAD
ncbi:MAG: PQQ-dependent sugar dehydrogenase [Pseudomonadota bacterium]